MPSDKRNSEIAKTTGLISSQFDVALSRNVSFANRSGSNTSIMVLPMLTVPLFSFVLYSFLHYRVEDNLRHAHKGFNVRPG